MTRRIPRALAACLLGTAALASGEPQDSPAYRNFVRASEVLDRAVAAHGGAKLLDRADNIRASLKGTFRAEGHYARPWASRDTPFQETLLYAAKLSALKSEWVEEPGKGPTSFTVVGPSNGIEVALFKDKPEEIPASALEDRMREELEIFPQEYLRQAREAAAGLRLLAGAGDADVVHYTLKNGENRALYFDAKTHLLSRVERLDHFELKGDRVEWRTFSSYADKKGILVPLRSELHKERLSTQYNVITELTEIEFGAEIKPEEVAIPAAFKAGFESWKLENAPAKPSGEPLAYHDLGKGVFVIDIPTTDSRALLVGFSDFSVVVEAGDRSEVGDRVLRTADRVLPGKPVRYVAMTHHHPLYANGLRPYVQRGVKVLVTEGNVEYYRDLVTRPYRIHPDEQQRRPKEPVFEVVRGGKHVIDDKTQRLELYPFDYSTHTDEYVLPYLPSHKLIVTGDMIYILGGDPPKPASSRELAIQRVIGENKLAVENILQTWFLERADMLTPYARLDEKLRLAAEKDAKK